MTQIQQIDIKKLFNSDVNQQTQNNPLERTETIQPNGSRAAHRKFLAEAIQVTLPTVAPDKQIEKDLKNLNLGVKGTWDQLMKDIGGAGNLSTYRTSDGLWSLLNLCGRLSDAKTITLTNAATTLLDNGFQYSAAGQNDLPPRYQWGWDSSTQEEENNGYCGETSFITAGLANGEYISQYDAREIAVGHKSKSQTEGQLLIGDNDQALAKAMHLKYDVWDVDGGKTSDFITWLTNQVNSGHPVAIGVYLNPSAFGETGPGQPDYDHVVVVTGIKDGKITFCDNGLYGGNTPGTSQFTYTYPLDQFIGTRDQA